MRPVINNYKIELRRDLPKLDYGVFYALFLIICWNGNKSSWTISHANPFSISKFHIMILAYQVSIDIQSANLHPT